MLSFTRSVTSSLSTRAFPATTYRGVGQACAARYSRNFSTDRVPEEDYYNGHLLADHLEYLNDMLDKTIDIENSMEGLKETHAKKYKALQSNGSDTEELDALFHHAASQKSSISSQVTDLKKLLMQAKNKYAVDGPDGTPDAQIEDDLVEIDQIIDYAADHEDAAMITKQHKLKDTVSK